jgi:hypothetical protein
VLAIAATTRIRKRRWRGDVKEDRSPKNSP